MNKKGDVGNTFWLILGGLVAIVVAGLLLFSFFSPKQKALSKETDKLIDITKIDKGLFDIRDLSEKEKEKCASFTNPTACMGTKTGCFWGKTSSGLGCFSCQNNKYFGDNFGKCEGYNSINSDDLKSLCSFNPCNFASNCLLSDNKCVTPTKQASLF